MKTPTDRQIDLLDKNLTNWAIVAQDCENLLEVFAFETAAKAKLARIQALGKGSNWCVRSITWKFSTPEMVEAQRSTESWIRGGADFSPTNAEMRGGESAPTPNQQTMSRPSLSPCSEICPECESAVEPLPTQFPEAYDELTWTCPECGCDTAAALWS